MSEESKELAWWKSSEGDAYAKRCAWDDELVSRRRGTLRSWAYGSSGASILEIGCNIGMNLEAVSGNFLLRYGIEPNSDARLQAVQNLSRTAQVLDGCAENLPFADQSVECVMTVGVLIHIRPDALPRVLREMARVAKSQVLLIEYFAPTSTPVEYHGDVRLWKDDFGRRMEEATPFRVSETGFLRPEDGFDNCVAWLLTKEG